MVRFICDGSRISIDWSAQTELRSARQGESDCVCNCGFEALFYHVCFVIVVAIAAHMVCLFVCARAYEREKDASF